MTLLAPDLSEVSFVAEAPQIEKWAPRALVDLPQPLPRQANHILVDGAVFGGVGDRIGN